MRRTLSILLLVITGFAVAAVLGAGASGATVLSCGDTVTQDTVLANDVTGCTGNGLIITASGITLDLAGHTISGATAAGTGLSIQRADNVTVLNGTVTGFGLGVYYRGTNVTLSKVSVNRNGGGIFLNFGTSSNRFLSGSISQNSGTGVAIEGSAFAVLIRDSKISRNGGSGVVAASGADGGRYEDNRISGNTGYGIYINDATSWVTGNDVDDNGASGIRVREGFQGFSDGYLIAHNSADRNGDWGIEVPKNIYGEFPRDGGGNTAKHNGNPLECLNIVCNAAPN
jgi:parallel beta-helix repeat protein